MKKITAILMALVLISSFAFVVSAEGEPVNYAASGTYTITPGSESGFLSSEDGSLYYGDDDCTILTDGVNPYYSIEEPGLGIVLIGSSSVHTITIDLGATYDDIYEITFGNVWDSYNFGYANAEDGSGKGNRGFVADKAIINLAADGVNFERNKDFDVVKENHTEDGSENGFYNFKLKFNTPVTAKAIELMIWSPAYCLSFSELEVWGYGHSIPTPEVSLEESSEEESVEESSEEAVESSEAEESKAEESKTESKAEESKTESKAEESKAGDETPESSPVIFIVIGVAVVAVVAVVIVVLKKKKQ